MRMGFSIINIKLNFASMLFLLFKVLVYVSQKHTVSSLYPGYPLDPEDIDIYEESHLKAVCVKQFFYQFLFRDELYKLLSQIENSPSYISEYISHICRPNGLFNSLTIFELLFTSCAFVAELCFFYIYAFGYNDILCYAHISWAEYFEQNKEEFYRQGGWNQLKSLSRTYVLADEFISSYPYLISYSLEQREVFILEAMKFVNNYKTVMSPFHAYCKTASKPLVKYHLNNFNKSDASNILEDATKAHDLKDPKVIEKFLLQFRHVCDINALEVLKVKLQSKCVDSCKQSIQKNSRSLPNSLTLNNMTASACNIVEQREIKFPYQEIDYQTGKQRAISLSRDKRSDQTDQLIAIDLSLNKPNSSSTRKIDVSQNTSFLEMEMSSSDKTQHKRNRS
ncbi:uncharacterized protein TNIN_217001 [Trichonephila inaurata madagascariensis]|uniref:Uncharacterized protein n=1 Tax=Trichonephila inaurata madagascariensis TaxID=2747483 RepID=A0A8X7C5Y0_9ARAC|nr:uncharacterized protein TNIN_217001 [Trichonephila inaurata madagascariensis]